MREGRETNWYLDGGRRTGEAAVQLLAGRSSSVRESDNVGGLFERVRAQGRERECERRRIYGHLGGGGRTRTREAAAEQKLSSALFFFSHLRMTILSVLLMMEGQL